MTFRLIILAMSVAAAACGRESTGPVDECRPVALPLVGSNGAPTILAVTLEVQPSGIVVLATATDPQGTDDLLDVVQLISVFRDSRCRTDPIQIQDDLAGSGLEESFGTAVSAATEPALYSAIASASTWPVEVYFRDKDGHVTSGQIMAPITH